MGKWTTKIIEAGSVAELMILNEDVGIFSAVKKVEIDHGLSLDEAEIIYEFLIKRF